MSISESYNHQSKVQSEGGLIEEAVKLDKERRRVERKRRKERREKGLELKTTRQTKNPKTQRNLSFQIITNKSILINCSLQVKPR